MYLLTYVFLHAQYVYMFITLCVGFCSVCTNEPTSLLLTILAGVIPSAVLIVVNIISVVVAILTTRHCCNGASQKSSPSKRGDVYDQVERPKTNEDIIMTDSPAYGPVK